VAQTSEDPEPAYCAPPSDVSILAGAEDGGELGAYHHRRYVLRESAVRTKLREYLPAGQLPVILSDSRLANESTILPR